MSSRILRHLLTTAPKEGVTLYKVKLRADLPSSVSGIYFRSSLMATWWRTDGQKARSVDANAVKEELWRAAEQVTQEWELHFRSAAQAAVNRQLEAARLVDGTGLEWFGSAKLSASAWNRLLGRRVLRLRRRESAQRLALLDQLRHLQKLTREQGLAALWWAHENPDRLHYLNDGSFRKLLSLQPNQNDYDLSSASDEAAKIIREFLAQVSDPSSRALLAEPLKIVSDWYSAERSSGDTHQS